MNAISPSFGHLPVAVIGAGPVGLAAAAHLLRRGLKVRVYEAAETVAAHVRDWGHVRLFSPWRYNLDAAATALLDQTGWTAPPLADHPTGAELYAAYLQPLAAIPAVAAVIETGAMVSAVSRDGFDKMKSEGRDGAPFVLLVRNRDGAERRDLARAVIDCSGTWGSPNPIGTDGLPVPGERAAVGRITYGIPDVQAQAGIYAGRVVLVVGAGHSAANVLLDLVALAERAPETRIVWSVRGRDLKRLFGGGAADGLAARGALGQAIELAVRANRLTLKLGTHVTALRPDEDGLRVEMRENGLRTSLLVDRVIVATGQRPSLDMLGEVRLDLDPAVESPRVLAPLIDPNLHSCGTVRPHGHRELGQPDIGLYIAGIKSYGRAPTFLMATGYEQVRSIVAALAGDWAAADDVRLDLPQTGVCSLPDAAEAGTTEAGIGAAASCCGPAGGGSVAVVAPVVSCCGPRVEVPVTAAACCGPKAEPVASVVEAAETRVMGTAAVIPGVVDMGVANTGAGDTVSCCAPSCCGPEPARDAAADMVGDAAPDVAPGATTPESCCAPTCCAGSEKTREQVQEPAVA